jgi:replicative DNA helicase
LLGGAPGSGKTALSMQAIVDALRLNDSLRALVCNIEMPPEVLMDRQLARLSGIDAEAIRYRTLNLGHADRLDSAMDSLEQIADRFCFVRPPFDLQNVAGSVDAFGANLILLDYIQRIPPPGRQGDRRGSIDATMNFLRQFADAGMAVIVVAAVSRQKDAKGRSTYGGDLLSLASFRESSELEFGADDAYILAPDDRNSGVIVLRHLKARHAETRDIRLRFDKRRQHFSEDDSASPSKTDGTQQASLAALWESTAPAGEGSNE